MNGPLILRQRAKTASSAGKRQVKRRLCEGRVQFATTRHSVYWELTPSMMDSGLLVGMTAVRRKPAAS